MLSLDRSGTITAKEIRKVNTCPVFPYSIPVNQRLALFRRETWDPASLIPGDATWLQTQKYQTLQSYVV